MSEDSDSYLNSDRPSQMVQQFKKDNLTFISVATEVLFKLKDAKYSKMPLENKLSAIENLSDILKLFNTKIYLLTEDSSDLAGTIKEYMRSTENLLRDMSLKEGDAKELNDKFRLTKISANYVAGKQGRKAKE